MGMFANFEQVIIVGSSYYKYNNNIIIMEYRVAIANHELLHALLCLELPLLIVLHSPAIP